MVEKGQLSERMTLFPFQGFCLEGIYLRGSAHPPLLVVPPWPGSMENPIVSEAAYAATYGGHASFRFNYRGVGASEGERPQSPEEAAGDLEAARAHLALTAGTNDAALLGVGAFGCRLALQEVERHPHAVDRLILVGPDTSAADTRWLSGFTRRVLVLFGLDDPTTHAPTVEEWARTWPLVTVVGFPETDAVMRRSLLRLGHEVAAFLDLET